MPALAVLVWPTWWRMQEGIRIAVEAEHAHTFSVMFGWGRESWAEKLRIRRPPRNLAYQSFPTPTTVSLTDLRLIPPVPHNMFSRPSAIQADQIIHQPDRTRKLVG